MTHQHSVLVVEDDAELREALTSVLLDEDLSPREASNGKQALECLREDQKPCLVLLDLSMPVMTGWEFLACQRRDPSLASIPVVVISAMVDHDDARPPTPVLRKPVAVDRLLEVVHTHLRDEEVRAS